MDLNRRAEEKTFADLLSQLFFRVLLDVLGVGYTFVAMGAAVDRCLPCGPGVGGTTAIGTNGKSGQELIQIAVVTGGALDRCCLQDQLLELMTALTTLILVDGHLLTSYHGRRFLGADKTIPRSQSSQAATHFPEERLCSATLVVGRCYAVTWTEAESQGKDPL